MFSYVHSLMSYKDLPITIRKFTSKTGSVLIIIIESMNNIVSNETLTWISQIGWSETISSSILYLELSLELVLAMVFLLVAPPIGNVAFLFCASDNLR